jgi:hypothetical protein
MNKKHSWKRLGGLLLLGLTAVLLFSVANVGAGTADCSNSTGVTGNIVKGVTSAIGTANNCTSEPKTLGIVSYKLNSDGSVIEIKRFSSTIGVGESKSLEIPIVKCATKVIFYTGTDDGNKANRIALAVFNHRPREGGYFCDQRPPADK